MDNRVKVIIIIALIVVVIIAVTINNKKSDNEINKIEDTNSYFGGDSDEDRNEIIEEFIKTQNIAEPEPIEIPKIDNEELEMPIYSNEIYTDDDVNFNLIRNY